MHKIKPVLEVSLQDVEVNIEAVIQVVSSPLAVSGSVEEIPKVVGHVPPIHALEVYQHDPSPVRAEQQVVGPQIVVPNPIELGIFIPHLEAVFFATF